MIAAPPLAVFDVDGALVRGDLLTPLVRAALSRRPPRAGVVVAAAPLIAWRRLSGQPSRAKLALLRAALGGLEVEPAERLGAAIAARAPLNGEVVAALSRHQQRGDAVWLASAQVEPIVRPLAERLAVDGYVATALEVRDGRLTGRYADRNCRGTAKVQALVGAVGANRLASATAYADSDADRPLMEAVAAPHWVRGGRIVSAGDG